MEQATNPQALTGPEKRQTKRVMPSYAGARSILSQRYKDPEISLSSPSHCLRVRLSLRT